MLDVILHDEPIGILRAMAHADRYEFIQSEAYFRASPRDVLGQQFEDRRQHQVFRSSIHHPGKLPPFFANLLPEGALRAIVDAQRATPDDAATLARVGEDLPGAVRVVPSDGSHDVVAGPVFDESERAAPPISGMPTDLRFSLAGIQLKFSAVRDPHDRFVLPLRGHGGSWIVKFSSPQYPTLAENEFATMQWAERCGITTPRRELIPATALDGLPEEVRDLGSHAFAIERYDRTESGARVHQEDFAQVLGVLPEYKYERASYEKLAQLVGDLAGPLDLAEFLRRLWFSILAGNTDAHLKNWSFIYPDRRTPRLSPAYDLVFVREYLSSWQMALPLAQEKDTRRIDYSHIARVERFLRSRGLDLPVERDAREFVARALDEWQSLRGSFDAGYRSGVDAHLAAVGLVS